MLFPVSGVEVNPLIPPLIALVVSTFTSMGGVSGAFLLLPPQNHVRVFQQLPLQNRKVQIPHHER